MIADLALWKQLTTEQVRSYRKFVAAHPEDIERLQRLHAAEHARRHPDATTATPVVDALPEAVQAQAHAPVPPPATSTPSWRDAVTHHSMRAWLEQTPLRLQTATEPTPPRHP